jgi:N,N'-diacetyllegionaminate synthase
MRIKEFDTDRDVLVVAEIGNNHEGSFSLAEKLVRLAAGSGVHAVKFQTFRTEYFINPKEEARAKQLKSYELSFEQFRKLSDLAGRLGLLFFSTPFDLDSAAFLKDIVSAYKIASGDNNFRPLLEQVAATGLPVIISGGLANVAQLKQSKRVVERVWKEKGVSQSMAVLHCVTAYPAPRDELNLGAIARLHDELQCTIGYSDHTIGIQAALCAVAAGARIIEKHFTIDKNYSSFRDHQLSADPAEMKELVRKVKEVSVMLGSSLKTSQESEKKLEQAVRRSIVAKRDLPEGTVLSLDDIMWTRPAGGLPPGSEHLLIGKRVSVALFRGDTILQKHLKGSRKRGKPRQR